MCTMLDLQNGKSFNGKNLFLLTLLHLQIQNYFSSSSSSNSEYFLLFFFFFFKLRILFPLLLQIQNTSSSSSSSSSSTFSFLLLLLTIEICALYIVVSSKSGLNLLRAIYSIETIMQQMKVVVPMIAMIVYFYVFIVMF